jgi:arylsulfatase A-like enzyme
LTAETRIFLVWRFVFAIASPFHFLEQARAEPSHFSTPNIVYILADDLGNGDVQCLNRERGKIPTPHLDRLAASGMTFVDAHSGSSVCTPTRYGILTGRYAWRTRLQRGVFRGGDESPLIDSDRITVPSLLRQHGYHTACLGKWHLGFTSEGTPNTLPASRNTKQSLGEGGLPLGAKIIGGPISRGFDYFFGFSNSATMSSLIEDDRVTERVKPIDMLGRHTDRAAAYIQTRSKTAQPFFLYLALNSPHAPIVPASVWHGKSGLGPYGDFVMQTDDAVGRVLHAIDEAGITDNTLVIFASDNGCSMVADIASLERQGHFPSGPYRGSKSDIWEGGHRIPLFVRWPNVVNQDQFARRRFASPA